MSEGHGNRRWLAGGALALAACLSVVASVGAQEQKPVGEAKPAEEAKAPNTGRVSVSAGLDWTTAYFFRGIKQETDDLILQPYGELTFKLLENVGALTSLSVTGGIWNSLQWGPTGADLGDNLKAINDGDRVQVIGTLGIAFAY